LHEVATIALVKGHSWIATVDAIFLVCVGEIEEDLQVEKHSFGLLIRKWMKNAPEPIPTQLSLLKTSSSL
jgi:hypothetical protein